jgi:hypothetical protein
LFDFSFIGWNPETIFSCIIILLTFLQAWSLVKQKEKITSKQSGQSASLFMFTSTVFFGIMAVILGFKLRNFVIVFNCGIGLVMNIPPSIELLRFKKLSKVDIYGGSVFVVGVVLAPIVPLDSVKLIYAVFSFLSAIPMFHQILVLWQEKKPGVLEFKMLVSFLLISTSWLVYSFIIQVTVLEVTSIVFVLIRIVMLLLWIKYYFATRAEAASQAL